MPSDRFLHPRCGHSAKVTALTDLEYRVWTQYLLSSDDFGVMRCSAVTLQADNDHLATKAAAAIERCLAALITCALLSVFEHQKHRYVFQRDWQTWQKIGYPRATDNPKPPGEALAECDEATQALFDQHPGGRKPGAAVNGPLSVNERHLRGLVAAGLSALWPEVSAVAENVRLGNSYADVIVTRTNHRLAVVEVKRTQVYKAALVQVRGYGDVVRSQYPEHDVALVVVGRGVAESVTAAPPADITVVAVDDSLSCTVIHRAPNNDLPDKFSLDPKNLTVIYSGSTSRAGGGAERLTANGYRLTANGSEGGPGETIPSRRPRTAPIHDISHRKHAHCGRVCLPASLFGEFVRRRNHADADREVRDWALEVEHEWSDGPRAGDEPGDPFEFWKARYSEKWPSSKVDPRLPAWAR